MRLLAFIACLILLFVIAPEVRGASDSLRLDYYFPELEDVDPAVPTPEEVIGYLPGELHWQPEHIAHYMRVLAETSPRVKIEEYAHSHEQRPLQMLTISAPANLARTDALLDERAAVRQGEQAKTLVVWLGYGVHGNEASASNAAVLVAYYLAASRDPFVTDLLANSIVLLDPVYNPDGLARFTQWVNSFHTPPANADPQHYEHREAWPGGRTNHFWFDLNRDWLPAQHPESQGRLTLFHRWLPHVLTDVHEMGGHSTYFFQPGIASRNNPLTPARNYEFTRDLAEHHSHALDEIGSLYYTGESFDDFYIGKGSTYPDVNGSVGILFEQGSARGHARETDNGVITFPFAIRNQITTSLSTLRGAQAKRDELIRYQADFFNSARAEARSFAAAAVVFGQEGDRGRLRHMLELLLRHKIEVRPLQRDASIGGRSFKAGAAYAVNYNQPQHRLVRSLFERRTQFQDSLFYDVSAWTIPLAFGVPAVDISGGQAAGLSLGANIDSLPAVEPGDFEAGAFAYAFSWKEFYSARVLTELLQADVHVRFASGSINAAAEGGNVTLSGPHVIVPVAAQEDKRAQIERILADAAQREGIAMASIGGGLSGAGPDLGSPSLHTVKLPRIGLLVGDGIYGPSAGAVWHLLEHRIGLQVSLLDIRDLNRLDLQRYTDLILTAGWYSSVDSTDIEALQRWIHGGGQLTAMEEGVAWLANNHVVNIKLRDKTARDSTRRAYGNIFADRGAQNVGGVIVSASVDQSHPLAFGINSDSIAFMRTTDAFIELPSNRYAVPFVYSQKPVLSGYLSAENQKLLAGSAAVLAQGVGRGRVIMLADHPAFRAKWFGASRILFNALFFGDMIDRGAMRLD